MCAEASPTVIAVDGGGTRCRVALDGPEGRLMVETGPANVSSDFDAAVARINAGLKDLATEAGLSLADLAGLPAYVGLAGMLDAGMAARVGSALPLRRVHVDDDRRTALRGALGARDGAIAHFGTGSFFGLQVGGTSRLAGGWGSRLGDEGSAFWVGRAALTATLETVDGLIAPTGLTRALLARFGSPGGIVRHAAESTPGQIAELAPMVTDAAAAGDEIGRGILGAGAAHITRVTGLMGWRPEMALCLTGGLGRTYRDYLPPAHRAALVPPLGEPIDGAVLLARALAAEDRP